MDLADVTFRAEAAQVGELLPAETEATLGQAPGAAGRKEGLDLPSDRRKTTNPQRAFDLRPEKTPFTTRVV